MCELVIVSPIAPGGQVSLTIVPNEGHVIQSLTGVELYDLLDSYWESE
ncbi:MAG: hypothetical protein DHS20C20_23200 [Ardenticatenaceae bacterium]|nr:MAG: hypothetical protein DHS20C20_23200 [Ardenticatenaceae bacterium]